MSLCSCLVTWSTGCSSPSMTMVMRDSLRVFAEPDGQALDVEAAAREEPGDPREHAGLVLDEDGEGVLHDFLPLRLWPPIISVIS